MEASRVGLHVSVNSRADIILSIGAEGGHRSVVLDTRAAERLIEALTGACSAAREVTELGRAADAAATTGLTDSEEERDLSGG